MKIYTRKGDDGTTGLIGGTRVSKAHVRLEAYGTVDELNSWIGMIRDSKGGGAHAEILEEIQNELFTIGSQLANDPDASKMTLPAVDPEGSSKLEQAMDEMNEGLPELKNFILPGGHPDASMVHVARCVCRRAERKIALLASQVEIDPMIIGYVNRLSDYLFVLARAVCHAQNGTEIAWKPRG